MDSKDFKILRKISLLLLGSLTLLITQSCSSKKDLLYFQDSIKNTNISDTKILNQKIEPNDILSIKIFSLDAESSKVYNIDLLESTPTNGLDMVKLKSYLVNDKGFVSMPILGSIEVQNKTTEELEIYLRFKLVNENHLKDPTVTVRILNAKVTVLGEVKIPGTYTFPEKNITFLQALGLAGDLTINGVRKDVLLIRQEGTSKTIHHLNLNSKEWMNTDLFYIKQNDVIVVHPNNAKIKSSGIIGNAGTLISFVSLLLTGFLLIKN